MAGAFASRLCGSADIYDHSGKAPVNSINFVTCHDGFTLQDLVAYERKDNWANGEDNRDGADEDFSANYGVEGPTEDTAVSRIRLRQMKNFIATLFLSRGVPMLLGGDEFGRTQRGNNNAYCQDNDISWYDWQLLDQNRALYNFVRGMIAFRARHPVLAREQFYRPQDLSWFNPFGWMPEWSVDAAVGCQVHYQAGGDRELCLLFNPAHHGVSFVLPRPPEGCVWVKAVDTAATAPFDVCPPGDEIPLFDQDTLLLGERALAVLVGESDPRWR
jgi:glycogen operon protein